jgi:hypothetical protein
LHSGADDWLNGSTLAIELKTMGIDHSHYCGIGPGCSVGAVAAGGHAMVRFEVQDATDGMRRMMAQSP